MRLGSGKTCLLDSLLCVRVCDYLFTFFVCVFLGRGLGVVVWNGYGV